MKKNLLLKTLILGFTVTAASCQSSNKLITKIDISGVEEIQVYRKSTLKANVTPADATNKNVTWSVDKPEFLFIDEKTGDIKGLAEGSVTVTASAVDGSKVTASKNIKVTKFVPIAVNSVEIVGSSELALFGSSTFTYKTNPENADIKKVEWSSSDENVAKVSETGEVSTLSLGAATITLKATDHYDKTVTATKNIKVSRASVSGMEAPDFQKKYAQNIQTKQDPVSYIKEITTQNSADAKYNNDHFFYYDDEKKTVDNYQVGTVNPFIYKASVTCLDKELEPIPIGTSKQDFELYIKNGENFDLIDKANLSTYLDLEKCGTDGTDYYFKDAAGGHTFKLKVYPSKEIFENEDNYSSEMIFDVVKGAININTQEDLLALDNKKFDLALFQNDISLTNDKIPNDKKYNEEDWKRDYGGPDGKGNQQWKDFLAVKANVHPEYKEEELHKFCKDLFIGSLKDPISLIYLTPDNNNSCSINGNYFHLNIEKVKRVVKFDGFDLAKYQDSPGSTSQIFRYDANTNNPKDVYFKNLSILGNAQKSSVADEGLGGLIALKTHINRMYVTNVVATACFTNIVHELNDEAESHVTIASELVIDRCRFKDSYNAMIYLWGAKAKVTNSYLKDAGGSIFILDEVYQHDETTEQRIPGKEWIPELDLLNTYAESFVTGQEQWFKSKKIVEGLDASFIVTNYLLPVANEEDKIYKKYSKKSIWGDECEQKTFGKMDGSVSKVNMIALCLSAGHLLNKAEPLKLKITANNKAQTLCDLDLKTNTTLNKFRDTLESGLMAFQSSAGGMAYADQNESFVDGYMVLKDNTVTKMSENTSTSFPKEARDNFSKVFSGDYCSMYLDLPLVGGKYGVHMIAAMFSYK